jgi:hypothetical protein
MALSASSVYQRVGRNGEGGHHFATDDWGMSNLRQEERADTGILEMDLSSRPDLSHASVSIPEQMPGASRRAPEMKPSPRPDFLQ